MARDRAGKRIQAHTQIYEQIFRSFYDNTMARYGSGTSTTYNARNYPTILAGGQNLGQRHGREDRCTQDETARP